MSDNFVIKLGKLWREYDVVGYLDNEFAGGLWNDIIAIYEAKLTHYEEVVDAARDVEPLLTRIYFETEGYSTQIGSVMERLEKALEKIDE